MRILGISCYFHDAAAALIEDGDLVAAAEEERFSRKKHDYGFPVRAIEFCLQQGGIEGRELDYVAFFEKPFLKFDRLVRTYLQGFPQTLPLFQQSLRTWLFDKLWIKTLIVKTLGIPPERVLFNEHHLSHAASAFFCSPFEEAAILTIDGVGEWATTSMGVGRGSEITLKRELHFPHSIGLLYSAFTAFLGFEVNEGEYKVMGMAPYGRPRYVDKVWKVVRQEGDGAFWLDPQYFAFRYSTKHSFTGRFVELFGEPRKADVPFFTAQSEYPSYYGARPANYEQLCEYNQGYADIAASIQLVTEELILGLVREAHRATGLTRLCLSGGVALNSVANGRILRETPIKELYVQPSAGDGGSAIGAALYAWHALGNSRRFVMEHAYWGKGYGSAEVSAALEQAGLRSKSFDDRGRLTDAVVDRLMAGKVVGWSQGRFEWGPRALGNRSIVADPRSQAMKDIVNTKIKFREPFRPFAPSVLAECASQYFQLPGEAQVPSNFMLLVVPVVPEKQASIPAVSHLGTARIQTVQQRLNPEYFRLIKTFHEASGVPLVLNTSFNVRGEPIVNSPGDAIHTFQISGIDTLVLENYIVDKP